MDIFTTTLGPSWGRRLRVIGLASLLALGLAACGDDDDDDATSDDAGSEETEETTTTAEDSGDTGGGDAGAPVPYEVTEISYEDVAAPAGSTLEIINTSGAPHTFTADDGSFDVEFGGDESTTVDVPDSPGEYAFHCEIHPSMQATLTAQ